jgi:two-component system phosphate regulon sensor histidine kinase PhoR
MDSVRMKIVRVVFWATVTFLFAILFFWFVSPFLAFYFLAPYTQATPEISKLVGFLIFLFLSMLICLTLFLFAGVRISRLRLAEAVARVSNAHTTLTEEQFTTLYDNSPTPFFLIDDAGVIAFPNKATLRFLGGTQEECSVANLFHFIVSDGERNRSELLKSKIESGVPVLGEEVTVCNFKKKNFRARLSIFSLPTTSKTRFRHTVTLLDVTQEYESEQMKTDFLLLASHQLRTPTTTIKWYTDYLLGLKNDVVGGIVREYLGEIYKGNERMMDLIRTLLTVSRIEMGTLEPKYEKVKLHELVEDVCGELASNISQRGTIIHKENTGNDEVVTDRTMMRVAIHNLLTNAIKYTPEKGEVFISLSCEQKTCSFGVRDTGCGIALSDQGRVFQKMFRAKNAKKMSSHGTGLGLFLTKSFMEKLGGTIDFVSTEGKGTTFTLTIPRVALGA